MKVECTIEKMKGSDDHCLLTFTRVEPETGLVRKLGMVAQYGQPMPVKFDIEWSFGNAQ